jgi:hypothetical protein
MERQMTPLNNSTRLVLFILEITQIIYNCVAPSSGFNWRNPLYRLYAFISIDNRFHKRNGGNVDCGKTSVDSVYAVHESVSSRRS